VSTLSYLIVEQLEHKEVVVGQPLGLAMNTDKLE